MESPCVYIMASRKNGTLYTGVTSDLSRRVSQHRSGAIEGFTAGYGCRMLVWYGPQADMQNAILREKRIKGGSRVRKIALIEKDNPQWRDLFAEIAQ
jgi:putative endonuclease